MAVTFDTLKFVKTLESAGMPAGQAEAISAAVCDSQAFVDVATKADVRELRGDMELMRKDLIIKHGGMMIVGFGTVIGVLLKLLG